MKLEINMNNLKSRNINKKIGLKDKLNNEIKRIFEEDDQLVMIDIKDIDQILEIGFNKLEEEKEFLSYLLSTYGLNQIRSAIEDILFDQVYVYDKTKGIIDHGEYSINGYLNPYLNNDRIAFIKMDIITDYL